MIGQVRDYTDEVVVDEGNVVQAGPLCGRIPHTRMSSDDAACERIVVRCRELCACEIPTSSVG